MKNQILLLFLWGIPEVFTRILLFWMPATVDMILSMVQQGFGIGFVPLSLAQAALQAERVWEIPLCEKVPPRQICLLQKKGMPLSGPARQLYRLILEKQEE